MTMPALLMVALVVAFVLHVYLYRQVAQRDREIMRLVRQVNALLNIWAAHWGEPAETVRPLLLQVLRGSAPEDR